MRGKSTYERRKGSFFQPAKRAIQGFRQLVRGRAGRKLHPLGTGIRSMILTAIRARTLRIAVVLLVGLMLSPAAAADDYEHMFPAGEGGTESECAFLPEPGISWENEDDRSVSHHICSCMVCLTTIGTSLAAGIPPRRAAEEIRPVFPVPVRSSFCSEIFHPPRA
jgi:hypothetical protein